MWMGAEWWVVGGGETPEEKDSPNGSLQLVGTDNRSPSADAVSLEEGLWISVGCRAVVTSSFIGITLIYFFSQ